MPVKENLPDKTKIKSSKASRLFFISFVLIIIPVVYSYAAPCYGTKMPDKHEIFAGVQAYSIFKRYLEDGYGKLRSNQQFVLLSYGVFDWLSIDLKGGSGNIKQHPLGSDEIDYSSGFAGGYGLRVRFYESEKIKAVFGFQHISVHPKSAYSQGLKNESILDDWQTSILLSYNLKMITPYLGTRWSRLDYIHTIDGQRKRRMSERAKSYGLIIGADIPITKKIWVNLEGSFFDSDACALSLNYSF